jgi:PAS domain S-box-containing protein
MKKKGVEIVIQRPNGKCRQAVPASQILRDDRAEITGTINRLNDTTARELVEIVAMRLAAVVRSSHDAVIAKDVRGTITDWNKSAERIFGYKAKEIIGKSILTIIPEDRQKEEAEILKKIRRDQSIDHYETVRRCKNGRLIDVSITISPIKNPNGEVVGASKIARDITREKYTARRLAEQARLLDLTNDAILVRDAQDRIIYWNRGARDVYGYSADEAIGKVTHMLLRTQQPQTLTRIRKELERVGRWEGELVHIRKDGSEVNVISRWVLDRDAKGKTAAVLETNTDITTRKRAEAALQQKEVELELIVTQTPFMLTRCTRDLRYRYVSRAYAGMLRRKPQEIAGRPIVEFMGKKGLKTISPYIQKALKGHTVEYETEVPFIRVGAQWLHAVYTPDWDLNGNVVGWFASLTDVSERKKAEDVLQKSRKLLERIVRDRTHALHTANKELRAEIELRKGLEGEILAVSDREQQRLGQELHDGLCQHLTAVAFMARSVALRLKNHRVIEVSDIERIAQLVNAAATDTRNLSLALHRSDVDADGLADALEDLVDREIWKIPCRLLVSPSFHIEDDAAAAQFYRIAREAVINANKHAQAREIVITLERSREGVVLRVSDDGVGFQVGSQFKYGLGYHIMKYRAQAIGGRLEIHSPNHGGTCVSCYLPESALKRSERKKRGRARFQTKIPKRLAASS